MFSRGMGFRAGMRAALGGVILWLVAAPAVAAQAVYLTLLINGVVIQGDSTISSLGRAGTIECSSFSSNLFSSIDSLTGAVGPRQDRPIKITKKIDRSTPLLYKALVNSEPVTSATFRFYRPSAGGGGSEEHFYSVMLEGAAISSISQLSTDTLVGGASAPPMMETVGFVFQGISWTDEINAVTSSDTWSGGK